MTQLNCFLLASVFPRLAPAAELLMEHHKTNYNFRAVFNWAPEVISQMLWSCIATLCDWLQNPLPLSRPIRSIDYTIELCLVRKRFPALGAGYILFAERSDWFIGRTASFVIGQEI